MTLAEFSEFMYAMVALNKRAKEIGLSLGGVNIHRIPENVFNQILEVHNAEAIEVMGSDGRPFTTACFRVVDENVHIYRDESIHVYRLDGHEP